MLKPPRLIIGLGNPGSEYERTRHNIGFVILDALAEAAGCSAWKKKFRGLTTNVQNVHFLKPLTYMNVSGESAREAMDFFALSAEEIVVFHDDLDLLPGTVKAKQGGGTGGHNGLKSLDQHIGPNYWRIRMGIGRPLSEQGAAIKGDAVTNFVLNPFSKADRTWLEPILIKTSDSFGLLKVGDYSGYIKKMMS